MPVVIVSLLETSYAYLARLSIPMIQHFGTKLRTLRKQHGLTLKELAQAVGQSSHGYISELEAGRKAPTAGFVLAVARLFSVSTDLLLRDDVTLTMPEERPPS